jgi:hypothetical protein
MAFAEHLRPPESRHRTGDAEGVIWVMIVILVGLGCIGFICLVDTAGG